MSLPKKAMPFLWHYCKAFKGQFLVLLTCLLIWAINESLFPYFLKQMVDTLVTADVRDPLWDTFRAPIVGIVATWLTMELSMRIYGFLETYLFPKFKAKMRTEVFNYVKEQSLDYFTKNMSGNVGSKIADIPKSSQHIMENLLWQIIAILFVFALSLWVVAQVSLVFTGVMALWCSAHMAVTFYYLKETNDKVARHYESLAELNGETIDIISNATSMRLFSRQRFETRRLNHYQDKEIKRYISAGLCMQKVNIMRGSISVTFIFANTYFLLKGWQDGWLSAGDFPLIAMSSFNLLGLIWHMSMSLTDMFRDIGSLNGALSLLEAKHSVVDQSDALPLQIHRGKIEVRQVGFGYRPSDPLFTDLCLTIEAGEKVGLVGFSGSGKTTFINLVLREFNVLKGRILIDGQDIATVTQQSLREQISVIPQEPNLFHRSIIENIRYGRLEASDEEVIAAAQKAHCHEFILKLEQGYHTIIGERGLRLSGGQRQRLSIARAVLKNAPILILDEATSALDSATENAIHESLEELMQNRTTIVIAHRLSTLKMMDKIIVFDKGKIVEQGTQEQLLASQGPFAHLWSLQQEGFLPDKDVIRG